MVKVLGILKLHEVNFYTYIIAGAGAAGLSLGLHLVREFGPKLRILIIDRSDKTVNDRTWCFWHNGTPPHAHLISKSWTQFHFADQSHGEITLPLGPWAYHMIRGIDFYRYARTVLAECEGVEFLQASVDRVSENGDRAVVHAAGTQYTGRYVFNSCYAAEDDKRSQLSGNFLWQDFHGWWIETNKPTFQTNTASLMDFRTPQDGETRFFYVLPTSDRSALVEHTIFGKSRLPLVQHEKAISEYLLASKGISDFRITERETGCIPMTDLPIQGKSNHRIVRLGALGGAVKPTTGFAFLRIQKQVEQIVSALKEGNPPQVKPVGSAKRYGFYDRLLLEILTREGHRGMGIFSALFRRNPISRVLQFLDESTSIEEEARLFATLPSLPFLKALITSRFHHKQRKRGAVQTPGILMTKEIPA